MYGVCKKTYPSFFIYTIKKEMLWYMKIGNHKEEDQ